MDLSVFVIGRRSLACAGIAAGLGLAGCAIGPGSYGPGKLRAGDPADQVRARMGVPTEQIKRADGTQRWVYARGPMGKHTWMIDVSADGRVLEWHQALEPARFEAIVPGMPEAELRSRLGPPAERRQLAMEGRKLLAWRYPTYECSWFAVTLSSAGQVIDAGYTPDPVCDVDHD
jgi:hypothetical protein